MLCSDDLTKCSIKQPTQVSGTGIVVLNHNLLITPDREAWSLSIFHIPSASSSGPVKMIQQLKLPRCVLSRVWIKCQSLPNPTGDGQFPKYVSSIPFMDDPDTALISISLPGPASLLVHRRSIMKLLPSPEHWTAAMEPLVHDWNSWGPPISAIQKGTTTTYGQRSRQKRVRGIASCDFNTYHVRRSVKTKKPNRFVPYPHADPILTELPCLEIISSTEQYSTMYIADGVAMGVKVNFFYYSISILLMLPREIPMPSMYCISVISCSILELFVASPLAVPGK
jgi:hypothetical protein